MLDSYKSALPEYQFHILRARFIRAKAFRAALGSMAGWLRSAYKRLKCRRIQRRAERELRSLNSTILKDMGVSRSDILWRVREAMPCS